jgi:tRNA (cmo5U34)-methyltransferase
MAKDTIYAADPAKSGSFEFNEAVASVFPDMLRRSIPGYAETIKAIGGLARRSIQPGSHCYDLGCSLGAATLAMRRNVTVEGCRIIGVDNAAAMVKRCQEIVAADSAPTPVDILHADIRDVPVVDASMVVMNYTLQFLPPAERGSLVKRIAEGMREGGVFVLSEKVVHDDPEFDRLLVDLHHDFKRQNAYSEMEIARKRAAIENVLIPDSVMTHTSRLRDAGFRTAGVWLRWFNFVSILAVR